MKGKWIALAGLLVATCTPLQGRDFYIDRIGEISNIEIVLNTETKAVNPSDEDEPNSYESKGNGFVVGNYVLTVDHVVSKYSTTFPTPFGPYTKELDRIEEKTFIDDLQIHPVVESRQKDLAIFDLTKTPELCERYCNDLTLENIATSEELYVGMKVYWMASQQLRVNFYRSTHIAPIREVKGLEEDGIKDFLDNSFSLNVAFRSGTSGKPIWSGDKIVGVGHYQLDELGYSKLMDEYVEAIKKYESK